MIATYCAEGLEWKDESGIKTMRCLIPCEE
jgi:hypothetical protein